MRTENKDAEGHQAVQDCVLEDPNVMWLEAEPAEIPRNPKPSARSQQEGKVPNSTHAVVAAVATPCKPLTASDQR